MRVVKVSEVSGVVLDWLVAKCEVLPVARHNTAAIYLIDTPWADKSRVKWIAEYSPTRHWAQGGPIIEREKIGHCWFSDGYSQAHQFDAEDEFNSAFYQTGPTPLIAAMRCYVASKLGETVEVPNELF